MRLLVIGLLVLLVVGCSTTHDKQHDLTITLISYEKAFRWGAVDNVMGYMPPGTAVDRALFERYSSVSIGGYQTVSRSPISKEGIVEVTVSIDYIDNDSMKVHKYVDKQLWEYDDEYGRWFLVSPLPELR